nr:hypothetical protein BdHM001_32000 [Bdellovibrio sp. HM001]
MYVYRLKSEKFPDQVYVGITSDIQRRLQSHNNGQSPHTSKYKPWKIQCFVWFEDRDKAYAFEKYLKSGSGRAFSSRHF